MITKENLIEVANKLYENIEIEFVEDNNPYWDIKSPYPEEIDENITVAKLYYETFDLEILGDDFIELCLMFADDDKVIFEREPEWLLEHVINIIRDKITERINYNEVLLDNLK